MTYTGWYKEMYSEDLGLDVNIHEEKEESKLNIPYCDCDRCGKPIKRLMYVVQSKQTGVEMLYLGRECIKKFA